MEKLQLKGIYIYPIKSIMGISLLEAHAGERGLEYDRRWMLIDEKDTFITQRKFHNLALIDLKLRKDHFILSKRMTSNLEIEIPLKIQEGQVVPSTIWDDHVNLLWPNLPADEWFSDLLKTSVRLVYLPDASPRHIDPKYVPKSMNTSLSDGYPYLLANRSSLEDISQKAGIKMEMERFRPNLVVETQKPFEEDGWKTLEIGSANFRIVKPCARCMLTTIDPKTGISGSEPLKTLNTYRKVDNKILFGQNMIVERKGLIRVGDEINLKQ
jgi:uncharacterized protein YcbX